MGFLYQNEVSMTRKVLSAAALTYVVAAAAAILQLLRLILLFEEIEVTDVKNKRI